MPPDPVAPLVTVEVFGDKRIMATLMDWAANAADPIPAYEAIHHYLLDVEEELFDTEGSSGAHGAWEDRKNNFRHHAENPVLRLTDALHQSLTNASDENHHWIVTPFGFAFGTQLDYAQYLFTGTEFMVPRRPIDLTMENRAAIVEIIRMFVTNAGLTFAGGSFFARTRGLAGRFIR
jgi:uncharacterized protein (DUF2384 family)